MLTETERTGWLRRRRDASEGEAEFWKGRRVESVAEHKFSTLAIAQTFLQDYPDGEEVYSKSKVQEILLIHDLAEARLGDRLQEQNDPRSEEEVLWQYGAFSTYRGLGNLWKVPELFNEFTRGQTLEARIAQDIDHLQFILQARLYAAGMSENEQQACEQATRNIRTGTGLRIHAQLRRFPAERRFEQMKPRY